MIIRSGKKKINVPCRKVALWEMGFGLMFRTRQTKNLLFDFWKKGYWHIHSMFVFFPFLIVYLGDKNEIVEWKVVKPFTSCLTSKKTFRRMIEIPLNKNNEKIIKSIVGRRKV